MDISADTPEPASLHTLLELLRGRRVVVLAGAGCSTESGIPDYRGPETINRVRRPVQYQEFVRSAGARARYWARSAVGWPRMAAAQPNAAHYALARLEASGIVHGLITQNVDGLHHAAGHRSVLELHGSLAIVRCLECQETRSRHEFQSLLFESNAEWAALLSVNAHGNAAGMAPDGDADLAEPALDRFNVPPCASCGGIMKPDVVFFGENVPRDRVDAAWQMFEQGDVLLVAGSSLTVYSGRRFVDRACSQGVPVAIINIGPTRADDGAAVKVEGRLGTVLTGLADALAASSPVSSRQDFHP